MGKSKFKLVYYIADNDIQEVAEQKLDRELSPKELKYVEERFGDYISWFDGISRAIDEMLIEKKKRSVSWRNMHV